MKPKDETDIEDADEEMSVTSNLNHTADVGGDSNDLSDDLDFDTSFDDNDLIASACNDEITAQLAAAGKNSIDCTISIVIDALLCL